MNKRLGLALMLTALWTPFTLMAASPPVLIDYQASVSGPGGTPLEGPVDIVFRLFDGANTGEEIAVDSHLNGAAVAEAGLINVKIGGGVFTDGTGPKNHDNLSIVIRNFSTVFVQVEINGEILLPRVQITSAAYALNAATLDGNNLDQLDGRTQVSIATHASDADAHHTPYGDAAAIAAVAASNLVPQAACDGEDSVLRWTGTAWSCEALPQGQSDGNAKGFEIVDGWSEGWDGIERGAKTWSEAKATCESLGARLPSITELYRNNVATGSGNLSDSSASNMLWTLIPDAFANSRTTVRLDTGQTGWATESALNAFRCVWPDSEPVVFDNKACYGPPGLPCSPTGSLSNIDQWDRAPVSFVAASNECNFYKASIPDTRTFQEAIQNGLPNATNNWLWAGDSKYVYSGNFGATLIRFATSPTLNWSYQSPTFGSFDQSDSSSPHGFRCVGRNATTAGVLPDNPPCNGGCFTAMDRGYPLYADSADRAAATQDIAAANCAAEGGALPHMDEFTDLAHAGWPSFSNWLWSSDPAYWYSNGYGWDIFRDSAQGSERWGPDSSSASISLPTSTRNYRCIWRTRVEPTVTVCAADEVQLWDGSAFQCQAAIDGDANGNGNPIAVADGWGNEWDAVERGVANFDNAREICELNGGSLPLPGELYRVRYSANPLDITLGGPGDTSFLWTLAPGATTSSRTTLRLSDGASSATSDSNSSAYRCIWRSSRGDVFGSRDCHGDPAAPCFQAGNRRWDNHDRATVTQPAAAYECSYLGGRLPNADDFQQLVAAGAPNGRDVWLWISESMYWYNGNYGYAIGKWTGKGPADWTYTNSPLYGSLSYSNSSSFAPFRCVFSTEMK